MYVVFISFLEIYFEIHLLSPQKIYKSNIHKYEKKKKHSMSRVDLVIGY